MQTKIKVSLGSLDKAIKEIELLKKKIEERKKVLLEKLCERGAEIAREECPVDTGDLRSSIQHMVEDIAGMVVATSGHAAYVEFGTGVVGSGSPHPTMPWAYDVNAHGFDGWWYMKNDELHWTAGMPARPFMYNTAKRLAEEAPEIAKEVFSEKY